MKIRAVITVCLLAATVAIAGYPQAATVDYTDTSHYDMPEDADSAFILNEVSVTANRRSEVIPSARLDGQRLQSLSAMSVADAIRHFSGVQVKDFGGIGGVKTINIRSMGSQHTGVYYDGIQLGNAQNGQVDLGRFDLSNLEEISLYNGNKSNIFQGARDFGSAGSVYLRTRRPRWQSGQRHHVIAAVSGGSFGLVKPEVTVDYRITPAVSVTASAGYTYADGRYRFRYRRLNRDGSVAYDTTATRHNGDINALRTELAFNGHNTRGTWMAKAYLYDSERGVPGAIVNNVFRNGERQWDRTVMVHGRTEQYLSPRYSLMVAAKYSNDYMRYLRDDPRELYVDNRYYQQEAYVSAANLFTINSHLKLNAAVDVQWNLLNSDMADFLFPRRWTLMGAVAADYTAGDFSAQLSGLITSAADRAGNDRTAGRSTTHRTVLTPAAFFNWHPGNGWQLTAFVKESWRLPTFNDLYYTEIGNKDLRPERTWQFDLGLHRTFTFNGGSLTARIEAYHNRVTDKIIAYPAGQQFRWTMLNLGFVSIFGVEVGADTSVRLGNVDVNAHAGYTWQSARDLTDPADSFYGDQIPYIPHHSFSISASASWRGWQLNYATIYTGRRWSAQENIPANIEEPWYTHDMSAFKDLTLRRTALRLGIEINNIFGQDYEVIKNYPMPGRSFRGIIRIEI